MASRQTVFNLYRFQINPIDRSGQTGDMFVKPLTGDQLILRKNVFLAEALESVHAFTFYRTTTTTRKLLQDGSFYLYQIGAERRLNREDKDFNESVIDNWPSVYVGIWNEPDKQLIAIQKRSEAFNSPDTVIKAIDSTLDEILINAGLTIVSMPLTEERAFWDIVATNKGNISSVEFKFVTPNMAGISSAMSESLKNFAKNTNSIENSVVLKANDNSTLTLDEANGDLAGLVDYSSEGGGDITVKVSGAKKVIRTSKSKREFTMDEFEATGKSEDIMAAIKLFMS